MLRFSIPLLFLSILTLNAQASSILPQDTSTGTDGTFELLNGADTLFNNTNSIYNFVDFNIASGTTLTIDSNGPVYIYSQQSITINGSLITNSPDLHLIAQAISFNGSINSTGGDLLIASASSNPTTPDVSNGSFISSNAGLTITTGTIDTGTVTSGNNLFITANPVITPINGGTTGIITPSPVPVPAALWLMLSGILSIGLLLRRQ